MLKGFLEHGGELWPQLPRMIDRQSLVIFDAFQQLHPHRLVAVEDLPYQKIMSHSTVAHGQPHLMRDMGQAGRC